MGSVFEATEAVLTLQNYKGADQDRELVPPGPPGIPEIPTATVGMKFLGAKHSIALRGENERTSRSSYLVGSDPKRWTSYVASYERVRCQDVYKGIDGFANYN